MRSGVQELFLVGLKNRNSFIQCHGFSCFQHPVFLIQMKDIQLAIILHPE